MMTNLMMMMIIIIIIIIIMSYSGKKDTGLSVDDKLTVAYPCWHTKD
jgi:hypothetical protein